MNRTARTRQRGVAALAVSMLLLFGTTIVVFYLNRGLLFEQKTSANLARATTAFEAAEAGLEWATGMLNRPNDISTSCTFDTSVNVSFRRKYVQTMWNHATNPNYDVAPATNVLPGCYISGATLTCSCPNVPVSVATTATASLSPPSAVPSFTVSFATVAGDTESVQITSVGCNAATGACTSTTASSSDATATVRAILKLRPVIRGVPAAALVCGNNCDLGGSFDLSNFEPSVNGITVNSGGTSAGLPVNKIGTLPGIPPQNSIVASDPSLSTLAASDPTCSSSKIFKEYFATTIEEYQATPGVYTVTGGKDDFLSKYADGYRSFYFPGNADLQGTAFNAGTQSDPVTIVVSGDLSINSTSTIFGLVFSNDANAGFTGSGSTSIHGSVVTCKNFTANGNGAINYDAKALRNVQDSTATMARVPGSWRDF